MKQSLGVFGSDRVDLARMVIPASELLSGEERLLSSVVESGLPPGVPLHIQHDMHRLVGWSSTLGHLIDGSMVRVIGKVLEVESDTEKAELRELVDSYWAHHHEHGSDDFKKDLMQRVAPATLDEGPRFLRVEAFTAIHTGLAAQLYPEFFDIAHEHVDKDGLVDYRFLLEHVRLLQPGVYLDEKRQLLLFAHRFFRRSLSHRNKLNEYFLDSFVQAAEESNLRPRLRLDPDMVGHPSTYRGQVEAEYWHGPKFSDDINTIPSGVAVHSASQRTRHFEGVDKTHIWWKPEEFRDATSELFRTFEVEELIDSPSAGLTEERYGCRYAHAEYSSSSSRITHFDGAIRAYPAEAYLDRIDLNIDRAGKHSEYTKIFRFDGPMPVDLWKRLLNDYYRGNPLIPEYLGGSNVEEAPASLSQEPMTSQDVSGQDALCVFIHRDIWISIRSFDLEQGVLDISDDCKVRIIETGLGATEKLLRGTLNLSSVASYRANDGYLELPRLFFPPDASFPAFMHETMAKLTVALIEDTAAQKLRVLALALAFQHERLTTTLSLRGPSELVLQLLARLFTVVNVEAPASSWVQALSDLVRELSPLKSPCSDTWGVLDGRLSIQRKYKIESDVYFTPELKRDLRARGILGEG